MIKDLILPFTQKNQRDVISIIMCIWKNPGISKFEIEKELNLSRYLVSSFCNEMLELDYIQVGKATIREQNPNLSSAVGLYINPKLFYTVGMVIWRGFPEVALFDATGNCLKKCGFEIETTENGTPKNLIDAYNKVIDGIDKNKILGIGAIITGIIDFNTGRVYHSQPFKDCLDFNIIDFIEEHTNLRPHLLNVPHAKAMMEKLWGKTKELDNFIYTNESGTGFYFNGKPYFGQQMHAGEIGFMKISSSSDEIGVDGRNGLLSTLIPFSKMCEQLRDMISKGARLNLKIEKNGYIHREAIIEAIVNGDKFVAQMMRKRYEVLGDAIVNMAYLLNPEAIILDEWCSEIPEYTLEVIREKMVSYGMRNWLLECKIETGICKLDKLSATASYFVAEKIFEI